MLGPRSATAQPNSALETEMDSSELEFRLRVKRYTIELSTYGSNIRLGG
jgi:hypothetical protein